MIALEITAITLIILVFVSQQADLYIKRGEVKELSLSLTIFTYPLDRGKRKKKRKRQRRVSKLSKRHAYDYLLSHSEVTVKELDVRPFENTPLGYLSLIPIYAAGYSLLALIKGRARSFKLEPLSDSEDCFLEIKISFTLYHLIIFFLISLYYNLKYKLGKGRKRWLKVR